MDKLEQLKKNLYSIANEEEKEEMNRIFAQEVEIPTTGVVDIDQANSDWFDINDYMED